MKKFKTLIVYTVIASILLTLTALVAALQIPEAEAYNFDYAVSDPGNIRPTLHSGNSPLSMPGLMDFKQDDGDGGFDTGAPGEYVFDLNMDGTQQIKVWLAEDLDGNVFIEKWEAVGIEVMYFLVKGADFYFQYAYDGSLMTDGHLYSPRTYNNGEYKNISQISHFTIFYRLPTEETTAPSEATVTSQETTSLVTTAPSEATVTSEETTILVTTSLETTAPSDATITNATTTLIQLTTGSQPLASVTTTQPVVTTTLPQTTLTNPNIPQTGENGSSNGLAIGLILLLMAAGLTVVVYRSKATVSNK